MPKIFVFGIGGTGSRVLKSLTMLLASGLRTGEFEIVPILVDPHKDLKELNDCKTLLRLYQNLHVKINESSNDLKGGFFKNAMPSLKSLSDDSGLKDDFDFDEKHDTSFGQFLELSSLPHDDLNRDLLSLLYSEENFNKPLSQGFKGNPNVGSVVLNVLKDSISYKAFESVFGVDDRIFIISSIFGGTGAAGFPLLLKNFRNSKNPKVSGCQIGALSVMPYFKLSEPTIRLDEESQEEILSSDIDSENFLTKTKAALTYYIRPEFSKLYNSLYYIADPGQNDKPYDNNEKEQLNKAHFIELIGALSVINFANKNNYTIGEIYEYCLKYDNISDIDFSNMADETRELIGRCFTALAILPKLHSSVKNSQYLPFYKNTYSKGFQTEKIFFDNLELFFSDYFSKWIKELSENDRKWKPVNPNVSNDLNNLVNGYFIDHKAFNWLRTPMFSISQMHLEMAKACDTKRMKELENINLSGQYLSVCHTAINKVLDSKLHF